MSFIEVGVENANQWLKIPQKGVWGRDWANKFELSLVHKLVPE